MPIHGAEPSDNWQASRNMLLRNVTYANEDHLKNANTKEHYSVVPKRGSFQETDRRVCKYVTEKRGEGFPHHQSRGPNEGIGNSRGAEYSIHQIGGDAA